MSKAQQRKGRSAEIELSTILREHGYSSVHVGRAVSFGGEPDIVGLPGIHCELKRRENPDLSAALKQAETDAQYFGDGLPVVFHRGNRQKWRVTMTLDTFLKLYEAGGETE